ncbi:MAG: hypothetical protein JNL36_07885 [Candidatus Kapabacteria bacterium]|nr:hypothetical protein [Candidatus Kapabacteria bacterium]
METWIALGSLVVALLALEIARRSYYNSLKQTKIAEEAKEISKESKEASLISAQASKASAETAEKAIIEGFRPYVIVKMYSLDFFLHIEVVNIGNRPAIDVSINIEPFFDDIKETFFSREVINELRRLLNVKNIAPNQQFNTKLILNEHYFEVKKDEKEDSRKFKISYKSIEEIEYNIEYTIDILSFLISVNSADISAGQHLRDIEKQLEILNTHAKNINTNINKLKP